jgi:signal peptidase I
MVSETGSSTPGGRKVMAPADPRRAPRAGDRVRGPLAYGRETVESVIVAFAIALLFRAFEAEAFVIPTGSMAPTLMGRHKDLVCDSCGLGYRVGCSAEEDDQSQGLRMELARLEQELAAQRSIADAASSTPRERESARRRVADLEGDRGPIAEKRDRLTSKMVARARCPNCGYVTNLLRPRGRGMEYDPRYPSFSGDRILVDKFSLDFSGPERWDVVVFRYPEDAKVNYIKRLVGLPGETVSIAAGDIWVSREGREPTIARKPPEKLLAMLQCVHDSRHVAPRLLAAGWPVAWCDWSAPGDTAASAWTTADEGRSFAVDSRSADAESRLRFRRFFPGDEVWRAAADGARVADEATPVLIDDFQPYNALSARHHWVGDLGLECRLESRAAAGVVTLDLVEAGERHRCELDLTTGDARLPASGADDGEAPRARTRVRGVGAWTLTFTNVDDELSLFVDGRRVEFDRPTTRTRSIEEAAAARPVTDEPQPGAEAASDLAPVGIAARGASVRVADLRVLRDVFYIGTMLGPRMGEFMEQPRLDFPLESGQFFVLGDNSAASKDSRLWNDGHHVDRHLLVGEALVVFWPHAVPAAWNIPVKIGGLELRLPSWPNFARMRAVR